MPEIRETSPQYKSREELARLFDAWLKKKYKSLPPDAYSNLRLYYKLFLKETGYQEKPEETSEAYSQRITQGLEAGGGQLPYKGYEDLESRFPGYFELKAPVNTWGMPSSDPKDYYWEPKTTTPTTKPTTTPTLSPLEQLYPGLSLAEATKAARIAAGFETSPTDIDTRKWQESQSFLPYQAMTPYQQWQMGFLQEQETANREFRRQQLLFQQEQAMREDEMKRQQLISQLRASPRSWIESWMFETGGQKGAPPTPAWLTKWAPGQVTGQPLNPNAPLLAPSGKTVSQTSEDQFQGLIGASEFLPGPSAPWLMNQFEQAAKVVPSPGRVR